MSSGISDKVTLFAARRISLGLLSVHCDEYNLMAQSLSSGSFGCLEAPIFLWMSSGNVVKLRCPALLSLPSRYLRGATGLAALAHSCP